MEEYSSCDAVLKSIRRPADHNICTMSACGGKAVVRRPDFTSLKLNVRFSQERTFKRHRFGDFDSPLSAKSGRCRYFLD